jgi:Ca2+-transporting ATPase
MFSLGLFSNPYIWLGIFIMFATQFVFLYVSPVNTFFSAAGISLASWGRLFILGFIVYSVIGTSKFIGNIVRKK